MPKKLSLSEILSGFARGDPEISSMINLDEIMEMAAQSVGFNNAAASTAKHAMADTRKHRLSDFLAASLPSSHAYKYTAHYLQTAPSKHAPLYPSHHPPKSPSKSPSKSRTTSTTTTASQTTCQHHLLLVSHQSKFIYALEVLIYSQPSSQPIIYISKADTTGYAPKSISRPITTAFLEYILSITGGGKIQLFARSQPQYIFPFSATNGHKRILDDTQLIKWWLRVLSPLKGEGKVYIPGVEKRKLESYYPLEGKERWQCEPPGGTEGLAKEVIPVFPDDPKARYLHDLKTDGLLSTTTVQQFWELMEHRQECSSGRLVGFISMTIAPTERVEPEGVVVVTEKQFIRAYEMILNGEYSSEEVAAGATAKWIEAILAILPKEMKDFWGFELIPSGEENNGESKVGEKRPVEEARPVNMLGGTFVRKKQKK
jgi:hypothetical protein